MQIKVKHRVTERVNALNVTMLSTVCTISSKLIMKKIFLLLLFHLLICCVFGNVIETHREYSRYLK